MSAQANEKPRDFGAQVNELAQDYARIFKAGHDAGYRLGVAEGIAQAKALVDQHFPPRKVTP